jgi:ATP-dependent Clp protease, protease subunit
MENFKQTLLQQLLEPDDLETWDPHEHKYFGPSSRTLAFFGDVNTNGSQLLISQLLHLESMDGEESISILLNTEGGSLTDGLAIYDTIVNISCPVIIMATGLCASAGLLILSAADYKAATANTVFYYHQPILATSAISSTEEAYSLSEHYSHCQTVTDDIIKKRNKISKTQWNKNFQNKTSFYFNTQKALEFKLIDDIIESRKVKFSIKKD